MVIIKISSAQTIIKFMVTYSAKSVSKEFNTSEPNVSFGEQKLLCSGRQNILFSELNIYH